MGRYVALNKQQAALGVNTAGQQNGGHFTGVAAQVGRFLANGNGMQVGNRENAVVLVLHFCPVFYGTQVVAQGDNAGGLNGRQTNLFLGGGGKGFTHGGFPP